MKSEKYICKCNFCIETRNLSIEFNSFIPKTKLQHRMKNIIEKIEKRYLRKKNNSKNDK